MIKIHLITEQDLEFVRKLRNENRKYFFNGKLITRKEHQEWFNRIRQEKEFCFYVIWWDSSIRVGTISYGMQGNIAEIGNVIVDKRFRLKGVLRKTMTELFKKHPCKKVFLRVMPNNKNAIAAYMAIGFKEKARILWK
jgi:ribosomal protein S18 acetylase RimI-like enzyme